MRNRQRQLGWALGISLAVHATVMVILFVSLPAVRTSLAGKPCTGDLTLAKSQNYVPITCRFDDSQAIPDVPAPANIQAIPAERQAVPTPPQSAGSPQTILPASAHVADMHPLEGGGKTSTGATTGPGAAQPLHGPIVRPGYSIVYVLDKSGSMAQQKQLALASAMLRASLAMLGPDVRFQVVAYDSRATPFRLAGNLDLVPANAITIKEAAHQLDQLVAEGSSRHAEGLRAGLALQPDLLILLTDSVELSATELKFIRQGNRKATTIHAVLIGAVDAEEAASLRDLTGARENVHFVPLPAPAMLSP